MADDCRIRVLPDLLVNKIAAGEVVERPASVVKELMENAIDAGASRISVTIEEGGRGLIRVVDDGGGMSPEELRLAITPHATSKLIVEDDLYSIGTMGFRGEALASISSVSKLRIVSRPPEAIEGHEICVTAERVEASQAAGCPGGTTVEVRDLFFNVPARRKFLKAASTEVGRINEQFTRIALANPTIALQLNNGKRVTQNLPSCDTHLERISKLYGPELATAMLHVSRDERNVQLEAYAAPPAQSRATAQWQFTFVNGRYIRDRFIQHAIKESYRGLMEPNRHGVVFLFLNIDAAEVDVNVHPTKIEVRWADSNLIHSQVLSALRETFQRADLTPALRTDCGRPPVDLGEQDRIRREAAMELKSLTPIQPSSQPDRERYRFDSESFARGPGAGSGVDPMRSWESLYGAPGASGPMSRGGTSTEPSPEAPMDSLAPSGDVLGGDASRWAGEGSPRAVQMHNLYLVAETDDGIIIVDQHALHERIMYEQLRERMAEGALESQRLLLPETISVTPQQASLIEERSELLKKLGIEITPFGSDAVAVHAFPSLMKDTDVAPFMRDLLDRLAQQAGETSTEVVIHQVLDMMACKAAVKAGDPLTQQEIDALFRQRHLIDKSTSCPHGRPTMLRLSKADLNRQFHRT